MASCLAGSFEIKWNRHDEMGTTRIESLSPFLSCFLSLSFELFYLYYVIPSSGSSACSVYFNITRPLVSWECYYRTGQQKGSGRGGKKGPACTRREAPKVLFSLVFTLLFPHCCCCSCCVAAAFSSTVWWYFPSCSLSLSLGCAKLFHTIAVAALPCLPTQFSFWR